MNIKYFTLFLVLSTTTSFLGCVSIENAEIEKLNFNASGWKSQAGVSGDAVIEAKTAPVTDISGTGV
tara:strand:- start:259 stop:459 length:201 start_codon:yes stop_codon:yes gene_type:complete